MANVSDFGLKLVWTGEVRGKMIAVYSEPGMGNFAVDADSWDANESGFPESWDYSDWCEAVWAYGDFDFCREVMLKGDIDTISLGGTCRELCADCEADAVACVAADIEEGDIEEGDEAGIAAALTRHLSYSTADLVEAVRAAVGK